MEVPLLLVLAASEASLTFRVTLNRLLVRLDILTPVISPVILRHRRRKGRSRGIVLHPPLRRVLRRRQRQARGALHPYLRVPSVPRSVASHAMTAI